MFVFPAAALIVVLVFYCSLIGIFASPLAGDEFAWVHDLLRDNPLIDGHNDLPETFRSRYKNQINDLDLRSHIPGHTDIPRLRAGQVGGQFWSIFVECQADDLQYADQVRMALEQIDVTTRFIERLPHHLMLATSSDDVLVAHRGGRIASMLGLEGGHMMDLSLGVLRMYYRLGVRYMTLTHTCNVQWADSATDREVVGGLSSGFGLDVVHEMNRLGMLVDVAHVSSKVMRQAIVNSKAPVIFSHSSAFALCQHPRNVPDDVLVMLKNYDGVVMVNFYSDYIKCDADDKTPATLDDVVAHIMYIARVAGWKHVGIGADMNGVPSLPVGLEDVSKYPDLFIALATLGVSREQLIGLAGGNLLRVWKRAELVSTQLKNMKSTETLFDINKTCPAQLSPFTYQR